MLLLPEGKPVSEDDKQGHPWKENPELQEHTARSLILPPE